MPLRLRSHADCDDSADTAPVEAVRAVPSRSPDPGAEAARAETARLRRDIHDQIGSLAAATVTQLQVCLAQMDAEPGRAREHAGLALREATLLLERARLLSSSDDGCSRRRSTPNLSDALTDMIGRMNRACDGRSRIALRLRGDLVAAPTPVGVAAFWIVREALTNVFRHSDARHTWVSLEAVAGSAPAIRLSVVDDGDTSALKVPSSGKGLESMVQRAEELGGHCSARPAPHGGFSVTAVIPFGEPDRVDPQRHDQQRHDQQMGTR